MRVNLANPIELLELPGLGPEQATAIVNYRVEHGPIMNAEELARVLSRWPVAETVWGCVDFDPAETTAPEAPGG